MKNSNFKKDLFVAIIFLVILLSFNFILRQTTKARYLAESKESFQEAAIDIEHLMENRITRFNSLLYFGRKLFESSTEVTRSNFSQFYSEILTTEKSRYAAIDSIAFVEKVTDKPAYVTRIRQEKTKSGLQFLYFNLNNINDKKEAYIMNYLVPHESSSRYFGYDLSESEEIKSVFKKSAESDSILLSSPIILFGTKKLLLVEPVYRSNNIELKSKGGSLIGYIVLVINPEKMFDNVFDFQEIQKSINVRVFPEHKINDDILYIDINSANVSKIPKDERLTLTQTLPFNGKNLILVAESVRTINLSTFEQVFPDILFFVGSFLIVIFFFIMIGFRMRTEDDFKE